MQRQLLQRVEIPKIGQAKDGFGRRRVGRLIKNLEAFHVFQAVLVAALILVDRAKLFGMFEGRSQGSEMNATCLKMSWDATSGCSRLTAVHPAQDGKKGSVAEISDLNSHSVLVLRQLLSLVGSFIGFCGDQKISYTKPSAKEHVPASL